MDRDTAILYRILKYCNWIEKSLERFGDSLEVFKSDVDYRNSVCMNILQIGELVGKLSDSFLESTKDEIPWKEIRAVRNIVAHAYSTVNDKIIFEAAHSDVKELKEFCEAQIEKSDDEDDEQSH